MPNNIMPENTIPDTTIPDNIPAIILDTISHFPSGFKKILEATYQTKFEQTSDAMLGSLLSTLSATKPKGRFLELGTGSGLSTAWLLQGMDADSSLTSIDNDEQLVSIAQKYLGEDQRVNFIVGAGEDLILNTPKHSIDLIFADTWPGKYNHVEQTLELLKIGGIYLIDDMLPQDNWPEGHSDKANQLIEYLETKNDLLLTKMSWSSGIIICVKI